MKSNDFEQRTPGLGFAETSKPLPLRINFSWTLAGNIVYAGCQWGMLTVLAKIGTTEMVGQFALGLAITAPVFMFSNLQLRGVQATDARGEYQFGDYLALRLITTVLALFAILCIAFISGYHGETGLVILAIAIAKGFESLSDVFYGLVQQHERMDRIAQSMMLKGPISLLAFAIGIILTGKVFWGTLGMAVVWALLLLLFDVKSGLLVLGKSNGTGEYFGKGMDCPGTLKPRWNAHILYNLIKLALPLGIVMLLLSLNTNIPRYFIEHHLGIDQLGIFAAMAYLVVAGNIVVGALGQSASPRLSKYYATGDVSSFLSLLWKLLVIGAVLGIGGLVVALLAGRELLGLIYTAEYGVRSDVFVWLMVGAVLTYLASFLGYGMTAARYFRVQFPLFAIVTGCTVLACYWFIPALGLTGAALAVIVAVLVQLAGSVVIIAFAIRKIQK